jgi:hypothetical protein
MGMGAEGYRLLSAPGAGLTAADHPDALADGKMGRLHAESHCKNPPPFPGKVPNLLRLQKHSGHHVKPEIGLSP